MAGDFGQITVLGRYACASIHVYRHTLVHQLAYAFNGIFNIQQWTLVVGRGAFDYRIFRSEEANHDAARKQEFSHPVLDWKSAATGHDAAVCRMSAFDKIALHLSECRFPESFEDGGNGHPSLVFYGAVAVDELHLQLFGQVSSHGALANAHKPD